MLGNEQSSSSSSTNRREFFSMYASTALVEITASFFHYASHVSQSEFHFSPRPNRANEIKWRPWSDKAFGEAATLDRPILLSISAVWCHSSHLMPNTTSPTPAAITLTPPDTL